MKIYILRNIKDKDIDNYLFDLNDLKNKDLWDMDIYESKEFNKEFNELVKLDKYEKDEKDVKNVVNYLYSKIYDIEILEEEEDSDKLLQEKLVMKYSKEDIINVPGDYEGIKCPPSERFTYDPYL
jgi:hypothetical protein